MSKRSIEDEKILKFGAMVFGMMTDVIVMPAAAYARRNISFPTNEERTEKGSAVVMVFNDEGLADLFERLAREHSTVTDIPAASASGSKQ